MHKSLFAAVITTAMISLSPAMAQPQVDPELCAVALDQIGAPREVVSLPVLYESGTSPFADFLCPIAIAGNLQEVVRTADEAVTINVPALSVRLEQTSSDNFLILPGQAELAYAIVAVTSSDGQTVTINNLIDHMTTIQQLVFAYGFFKIPPE